MAPPVAMEIVGEARHGPTPQTPGSPDSDQPHWIMMPHSSNSARADRTPPRRGSSDGVHDSSLEITRDDDECGCAAGCGLDPTVENAGPTALVPPSLAPQPSGGGTTLQQRPLLHLDVPLARPAGRQALEHDQKPRAAGGRAEGSAQNGAGQNGEQAAVDAAAGASQQAELLGFGSFRARLRHVVQHWVFRDSILLLIAYDTFLMGHDDLSHERKPTSMLHPLVAVTDWLVLAVFTLEMLMKLVALGPGTHSEEYTL